MRLRTALLGIVPGVAHVDLGRPGRGIFYFFLFAFALNGALIGPLVTGSRGVGVVCALGAAAVWIVAFGEALRTAGRAADGEQHRRP